MKMTFVVFLVFLLAGNAQAITPYEIEQQGQRIMDQADQDARFKAMQDQLRAIREQQMWQQIENRRMLQPQYDYNYYGSPDPYNPYQQQ